MRTCGLRSVTVSLALIVAAQIIAIACAWNTSTIASIAVLHTADAARPVCLAAAVTFDTVVTLAQCVRGLNATQWTAQFLTGDQVAVANDSIPIDAIQLQGPAQAQLHLQRPPTVAPSLNIANHSEASRVEVFIAVHVHMVTHEVTVLSNVTRLPLQDCNLSKASAAAFICVNVPSVSSKYSSLLLDASDPMTLYGFSIRNQQKPAVQNSTAFALLSSNNHPIGVSTSNATNGPIDSGSNMGAYVVSPDVDATVPIAPSYMAGLRFTKDASSFCGGSLIAPQVVLTAAHCLERNHIPAFVAIGSAVTTGYDPQSEQLPVEIVRLHPQYNANTMANDFALVFLSEPSYHAPIRLENRVRLSVTSATVYGYGVTHEDATELSPLLRAVELPLITSRQQCDAQYKLEAPLDASFLCAGGDGGRDACMGDSGGPLVIGEGTAQSLLGVVSAGDRCGVQGRPGLYAWVGSASAVAFISTHVRDAQWTEAVRMSGVVVPVVAITDQELNYPHFVDASSANSPTSSAPGTSSPPETTPTPEQRESRSPLASPPRLFRVEFGGEDLTPFTRMDLLHFLAGGNVNGTMDPEDEEETTSKRVRFTLLSTARLDALMAVITHHDMLALHRRRNQRFHGATKLRPQT